MAETEEDKVMAMTILEKIAAIRDEAKFVKDAKIQTNQGSYDIWTEAAVLKELRPLFKKYRVLPIREQINVAYADAKTIKIVVGMRLYDLDGPETQPFTGIGTGFDKVDKDSGKASTYATKDAYLKLFTAVSGLDPDRDSSDLTDAEVRAEAKNLLDKVWESGYFHVKAAKALGLDPETDGTFDKATAEATVSYQKRHTEIEEGKIADVANLIDTMKTLTK